MSHLAGLGDDALGLRQVGVLGVDQLYGDEQLPLPIPGGLHEERLPRRDRRSRQGLRPHIGGDDLFIMFLMIVWR